MDLKAVPMEDLIEEIAKRDKTCLIEAGESVLWNAWVDSGPCDVEAKGLKESAGNFYDGVGPVKILLIEE